MDGLKATAKLNIKQPEKEVRVVMILRKMGLPLRNLYIELPNSND